MWRVVMRPALLRPPVLVSGRTSDFSGVERVISTKSATLEPRRPGVVGLYLRIPISVFPSLVFFVRRNCSVATRSGDRASEDVDAVAGGDRHDGALGRGPTAEAGSGAKAL